VFGELDPETLLRVRNPLHGTQGHFELAIAKSTFGDLIWIEYQDRKARFRIVWVRDSQSEQRTQAAVHKLEKEECPWKSLVRSGVPT
jgi:hypothetical protein